MIIYPGEHRQPSWDENVIGTTDVLKLDQCAIIVFDDWRWRVIPRAVRRNRYYTIIYIIIIKHTMRVHRNNKLYIRECVRTRWWRFFRQSFTHKMHICMCACVCYITCSLNIIRRGREGFCMGLIIVIAESVRNNNNWYWHR